MEMSLCLGLIPILAILSSVQGQSGAAAGTGEQSGQQFCQQSLQCYQELEKLVQECEKQNKQSLSSQTPSSGCKASIEQKQQKIRQQYEHREAKLIPCLQSRLDQAESVSQRQAQICMSSPSSGPLFGPGFGGPGPVIIQRPSAGNSLFQGGGARNTANNAGAAGNSLSQGAAINAGQVVPSMSENVVAEGAASANRKKRQQGSSAGGNANGAKRGPTTASNSCLHRLMQKKVQCSKISSCCSEVRYCNLKIQSETCSQLSKLQLEIEDEKRTCKQTQEPSRPQGASGSTNGTSTANSNSGGNGSSASITSGNSGTGTGGTAGGSTGTVTGTGSNAGTDIGGSTGGSTGTGAGTDTGTEGNGKTSSSASGTNIDASMTASKGSSGKGNAAGANVNAGEGEN